MKHWQRVTVENCVLQPWVNGAGRTRELMAWPPQQDWSLRVSVATITQNAPYSVLPQTQRWHTILEGALTLTLQDKRIALNHQSAPYSFEGETPCDCELQQGPAKAFNIMTRGPYEALVKRINAQNLVPLSTLIENDDKCRCVFVGLYTQTSTQISDCHETLNVSASSWLWTDELQPAWSTQTRICTDQAILVLLQRKFL